MGTGLAPWGVGSGPCPVCGLPECRTDHQPFGAPVDEYEPVGLTFTVTENVYRDGVLLYAVNEPIPWEVAVAEGLVTDDKAAKAPAPKGKRTGGQRARRPAENRIREQGENR